MSALTDDWFLKPYDIWLAEARRIGALIGADTHRTRWKTSTCRPYKCVLEIIKDGVKVRVIDSKRQVREIFMPDPTRVPRGGNTIVLCPFHQSNAATQYETVLKESRLVTGFISILHEQSPGLFENGRLAKPYKWEFDRDRKLVVDIRDFPPEKLDSTRSIAGNPRFEGRLVIYG